MHFAAEDRCQRRITFLWEGRARPCRLGCGQMPSLFLFGVQRARTLCAVRAVSFGFAHGLPRRARLRVFGGLFRNLLLPCAREECCLGVAARPVVASRRLVQRLQPWAQSDGGCKAAGHKIRQEAVHTPAIAR
jgi:hypothetical protein